MTKEVKKIDKNRREITKTIYYLLQFIKLQQEEPKMFFENLIRRFANIYKFSNH